MSDLLGAAISTWQSRSVFLFDGVAADRYSLVLTSTYDSLHDPSTAYQSRLGEGMPEAVDVILNTLSFSIDDVSRIHFSIFLQPVSMDRQGTDWCVCLCLKLQ